MRVYDDEDTKPGSLDDLERGYAAPSSDDDELTDEQRKQQIAGLEDDFAAPSAGADAKPKKSLDSGQLNAAETGSGDQIGNGYSGGDPGGRLSRVKGALSTRRGKRGAAGGGIALGITGIFVAIFVALLPLKLNHIVQNLQDKFFGTSEAAVQKQTDNLMDTYIRKHVLPGLKGTCTTRNITKDCISKQVAGDSKASKLFRGWKDSHLENKLANDYGIEFYKKGNSFYVKTPELGNGANIDDFANGKVKHMDDITEVSRSDFRQLAHSGMENETKWKRVMYYFKVGSLLENKYGVKRCTFLCTKKDKLSDWVDAKKEKVNVAKILITQRVLEPRTETLGIVLQCVMSSQCSASDPADPGANGEKRSTTDKQIQDKLDEIAATYGTEKVDAIIKDATTISEKGFTAYIIDKLVSKAAGEVAGQAAGDAVPYVGALNTISGYVTSLGSAGSKLKKLGYATNSASMVAMFTLFRTHADEIKSGKVDATLTGSFISSLGSNTKNGQAAENSPLYAKLVDGSPTKTSFLNTVAPAKVYADAPSQGYTCDDGKPIPAGKQVCPEESLNINSFINTISDLFNNGPLKPLKAIADAWNNTIGKGFKWGNDTVGRIIAMIPGIDALGKGAAALADPVFKTMASYLVPSPINDNMSGARVFNILTGGADVAGNFFAQIGLGGMALTPAQASSIQQQYASEQQQNFSRQPFFARMFNTSSPYSLASRFALAIPSDKGAALQSTAGSFLQNPFGSIFHSFGSLLSGHSSAASPTTADDPFGVTQYGYPNDDPVFNTDPETYTDAYCAKVNADWANNTTLNNDNGQDEHHQTNPCLLNDVAISSAGGLADNSLIGTDDTSQASNAPTTTPAPGTPTGCPTQPVGADQTVTVQGIQVNKCIAANVDALINAAKAAGLTLGGGGWRDNNQQIALRIAHGCGGSRINDSSCTGSPPTAVPGSSDHERGTAIDFTCNGSGTIPSHSSPCFIWLAQNAATYGLKNLPSEPWHWSVDGH
jgi:hypothetical protein